MGGPIVRTGTNPKFWTNWDRIFADKPAAETGTGKKKAGSVVKSSANSAKATGKKKVAKAAAATKSETATKPAAAAKPATATKVVKAPKATKAVKKTAKKKK